MDALAVIPSVEIGSACGDPVDQENILYRLHSPLVFRLIFAILDSPPIKLAEDPPPKIVVGSHAIPIVQEARMNYRSGCSARVAHRELVGAVRSMENAEQRAVLWFAEIDRRKLYRELGYSSMRQYATVALKFSKTRTSDFLRLARRFKELPEVSRSVASGALGYTKAREIVKVASARTELRWLEAAHRLSRRDLERKIARVRSKARRRCAAAQVSLLPAAREEITAARATGKLMTADSDAVARSTPTAVVPLAATAASITQPVEPVTTAQTSFPDGEEAQLAAAVPVRIVLRMTAEQAARYDELWQKLGTVPNPEDLLEALAVLVEERCGTNAGGTFDNATNCQKTGYNDGIPRGTSATAGDRRPARSRSEEPSLATEPSRTKVRSPARSLSRPPFQVHVHQCPACGAIEAAGHPLDHADRGRLACDAARALPGQRNTTTIPPRTRREVLARDRHRCRAPGCPHTRFLEVHHIVPRIKGGTNQPENLITLCAACHRMWHERRL